MFDNRLPRIANVIGRNPRRVLAGILMLALLALGGSTGRASDHADPLMLTTPESNITGLFLFERDDRLIVIFNVRRALRAPKPYDLMPFVYEIHMDFSTPLAFDKPDDLARYGGTVMTPETLRTDAVIKVRLNDDATVKDIAYDGLRDTSAITTFAGVRDDPFIFPRFFAKNVISFGFSIPKTALPDRKRSFVMWGATIQDGKMVDFMGRGIRSQLPRFGFLNTIQPKDQLAALKKTKAFWDGIYGFLKSKKEWWAGAVADLIQPFFLIRDYDLHPDVVIYNMDRPQGFPNGRRLEDDIVATLCTTGDCLLQEISFIEGGWPRATANDKPFLAEWPYTAPPWPDQAEPPAPTGSLLPYVIGLLIVLVLVFWGIVEALRHLIRHLWRRLATRRRSAA